MQVFSLTLSQMLLMFLLMLIGFVLRKGKILPDNADTVMSKLEVYVFSPALLFNTMLSYCNLENFKIYSTYMIYSLSLTIVAIVVAYPLSRVFIRNKNEGYLRNVYKYALTFGNFGFMGNFLVQGVWGDEMLFKYIMFTFPVQVFCYSWGLSVLIPKSEGSGVRGILKSMLNPPLISLVVGGICGLIGIEKLLPVFLTNMLTSASNCMGPVAMILAGFVVGGYKFSSLLSDKKVYFAAAFRLIIIPAIMILALTALSVSEEIKTLALVAFATPLGLNTVVYPAAYGTDTKPGASMAMISHTLCVITIPIMYLIFIA